MKKSQSEKTLVNKKNKYDKLKEQIFLTKRKQSIEPISSSRNTKKQKNCSFPNQRNMNSFQHLLKNNYTINENTVNWVLNLRNISKDNTLPKIPDAPFSMYGKPIKCQEEKRTPDFSVTGSDDKHKVFFSKDESQLLDFAFVLTQEFTWISWIWLTFEAGLRSYSKNNKQLTTKEVLFHATAYKDRQEGPFFVRPDTKIKKGFNETIRAWEGRVPYPQYDSKLANTNYNQVKNIVKSGIEIGQLNWLNKKQLTLRNGGNHILGKKLQKGDFPFKKISDFATRG